MLRQCFTLAVALCVPDRVFSQATAGTSPGICFHARPRPSCSGFVVTTAGLYLVLQNIGTPTDPTSAVLGARGDWGIMSNVGPHDAVGVTLFGSLEQAPTPYVQTFALGLAGRYRRWLSTSASLDVGLGVAVATDGDVRNGSLFGLVKVSPTPGLGFAVRPEFLRTKSGLQPHNNRVALGLELGEKAGLVATPLAFGLAWLAAQLAESQSN